MPKIHLIKKFEAGLPPIKKVSGEENTFTSGFWTLSEETAQALINGEIYFHEKQREPSFYGGKIVSIELVQDKIVFKFIPSPDCKNIKTSQDGWSQEMKIVL
jgi:hypothetical protein